MAPGVVIPTAAAPSKMKAAKAYAVPSSAFEDTAPVATLAETPAERAARKAAKAARKAAKAAKAAAAGGEAAAPEKKRKRDAAQAADGDAAEPSAAAPERAAKAAKATPRLSNTEYRTAHEIKVRRLRKARAQAPRSRSRRLAACRNAASRALLSPQVATDCPDVYQTFEEAGFPEPLLLALRKSGFVSPSPIQAVAWPLAMAGRDLIAVAKTGSGKTCGYLLPHLSSLAARGGPAPKPTTELQPGGWWKSDAVAPSACVLAPTRELALQIADEASKFASAVSASVVCMYGGVAKNDQLRACREGCDLIVATPGRLCDFLEPPAGRTPPITVSAVKYLVLDEADRMLDMVCCFAAFLGIDSYR